MSEAANQVSYATYDPEADAIGVWFPDRGTGYVESEEVAPGVILDLDDQGRVIGVQLLYVAELLAAGRRRES